MRFAILGLTTGCLMVGLAWAGLFIGLTQSGGLVRYPGAIRVSAVNFQLDSLPDGRLRQHIAYHTADHWWQVFLWYADYLNLELDRIPRLRGDCVHFADTKSELMIRQNIQVTLCARASGTRIWITRQWTVAGRAVSFLP
jgi:hypothetical protein